MTEEKQQPQQETPPKVFDEEEQVISLLDLVLTLVRGRKTIGWSIGIFLVLGLCNAIFSPHEYTATAKLIREEAEQGSASVSGLAALRGLGISLGGGTTGLTEETYPDILQSREVFLAILHSRYYFGDLDTNMTLADWYRRPPGVFGLLIEGLKTITIDLPGIILRKIKGAEAGQSISSATSGSDFPTREELEAIEKLSKKVSVSIDRKSGVMGISVATHNPQLSMQVVNTFIHHLAERVRTLYSKKARENLEFIQDRFREAKVDLETVEDKLAQFLDRNQDIRTAALRTEQERLQRQVTFQSQLYGELQTHLMQSEIELQRNQPVITLLEAPVPPHRRSAPRRKLIVLMSLFLGTMVGVGLVALKSLTKGMSDDAETLIKLAEIKRVLRPKVFVRWKRRS